MEFTVVPGGNLLLRGPPRLDDTMTFNRKHLMAFMGHDQQNRFGLGGSPYSNSYLIGSFLKAFSRRFLKKFIVLQSAASLGRSLHQFITWWEKQFCLIEVIALGLSSFHLCSLVGLSFRVKMSLGGCYRFYLWSWMSGWDRFFFDDRLQLLDRGVLACRCRTGFSTLGQALLIFFELSLFQ